jgi:hypothetical protein
MNRDTTIIQIAVLLIVIAIIWLVVYDKPTNTVLDKDNVQKVVEWVVDTTDDAKLKSWSIDGFTLIPTLISDSEKSRLVKRYFQAIANNDYTLACSLMSTSKCASIRPGAVTNFSREFAKLKKWYEFVDIQDRGITAPSGKDVVCVKYQYTLLEDSNPTPVSEILSYYIQPDESWDLRITDRVCEKKYKEGWWVRDCPIEPNARFCVERI